MKKSSLVFGVFGLACMTMAPVAFAAPADQVQINQNTKTVELDGRAGGVSAELFNILDRSESGVVTQGVDGRSIAGTYIQVSVLMLNGSRYSAQIVTQNEGEAKLGGQALLISGKAAEELYTDMERARFGGVRGVDTASVKSGLISCTAMFVGSGRYSCTLTGVSAR